MPANVVYEMRRYFKEGVSDLTVHVLYGSSQRQQQSLKPKYTFTIKNNGMCWASFVWSSQKQGLSTIIID